MSPITRTRRGKLSRLLSVAAILSAAGTVDLRAQAGVVEPSPAAVPVPLRIYRPTELVPYGWRMLARTPYDGSVDSIPPKVASELQDWARAQGGTAVLLRSIGDAYEAVVVGYPGSTSDQTPASEPSSTGSSSTSSGSSSGCSGSCT